METLEIGTVKSRLELKRKAKITELFPRLRFMPSYEYCWSRCEEPFSLDIPGQHNPHMLILGSSGTGKSSLCKLLLNEIAAKLRTPVIILDVHNEYIPYVEQLNGRVVSPKSVSLNIFELDKASPLERAYDIAQLFKRVLGLGDVQAYGLIKCIEGAYKANGIVQDDSATWALTPPTMKDVFEMLELTIARTRSAGNPSLLTLSRRLYSLLASSTFNNKTTVEFGKLADRITCFTLGDLAAAEAQAIFVETFLRKLYSSMLCRNLSNGVNLYVLIDEAHRVVVSRNGEPSLVAKIACEARKYGIGLIISNQNAKNLDREIIANCATNFIFYQKEPGEEEYVVSLLANGSGNSRRERMQERLRSLGQFECLAITSSIRDPVHVRFEPFFLQHIADGDVRNRLTVENALGSVEELVLGRLEIGVLGFGELLNFIGNKCNAVDLIKELGSRNLLELLEIENLHGIIELWVGRKRSDVSLEHRVYVRLIADFLAEKNVPRVILDNQNNPDIVMELGNEKVAIEVETGRKRDNRRIEEMLRRRMNDYAKVIVVTPEENVKRYRHMCSGLGVQVVTVREVAEGIGGLIC